MVTKWFQNGSQKGFKKHVEQILQKESQGGPKASQTHPQAAPERSRRGRAVRATPIDFISRRMSFHTFSMKSGGIQKSFSFQSKTTF